MDKNIEIQQDLLLADVSRIVKAGIIAVDCEMGGLNPHRDFLYLIQISDPDGVINVIKTSNWIKATQLKQVFTDDQVIKVFHFAIMDCAFINQYLCINVQNSYCTKIASKLARTYSNSHSLNSLTEELVGCTLDKKNQTTYWGNPVVSAEKLQYAIGDVQHLLQIKGALEHILEEKGVLPSGISFKELNRQCQQFIPTLVHLWTNGWDFGKEDPDSLFGR